VPLTFLAFWRGTFLVLAFERVAEIFLSTFCTWFPKLLHVVRHHGIVASFADIAEKCYEWLHYSILACASTPDASSLDFKVFFFGVLAYTF